MDISRLEYFLIIAQTQNLREASEIIGLTVPALSKAMKKLEEEMNSELWSREGRRIALTDQGKILFKKAPSILNDLKQLKDDLYSSRTLQKSIRLGTFEVFSTYFLSFLKELNWQEQLLELHELLPGEIEKYLIQGDIDLGISYMPIAHPELDFLKVTSIEMGVYTSKRAFTGIEQPHLPFVTPIMPLQGVPTKVRGLDGWPESSYSRNVKYKVTLMESALELCRQGHCAGYFPNFIINEHNKRYQSQFQLIRRRYPNTKDNCYSDVFLIKRKSTKEDHVAKKMARAIRLICK